tara:strand:+ start:1639 stop:2148 length:510 start_codon:yes stop_codon:yes gene_type:complete
MTIISGTAYWAKLMAPDTEHDSDGQWSIVVGDLDKKNADIARASGLTVKNNDEQIKAKGSQWVMGDHITLKRNARNKKTGEMNSPPSVVNAQRRPIMNTEVGNHSLITVKYSPWKWNYKGKHGVSGDLTVVQVTDLVVYTREGDDLEGIEVVPGGYTGEGLDEDITLAS